MSEDLIVTVTLSFVHVLFFAFVIVGVAGFSLSIFIVTVLVALFPALSVVVILAVYVPVVVNVTSFVPEAVVGPVMLYDVDLWPLPFVSSEPLFK